MHSKNLLKKTRIQFQKLDTMLLNDVRLFLRDRKSLILVVLTPFLILSILIYIFSFSGVAENIKGVTLGICDDDVAGVEFSDGMFKTVLLSNGDYGQDCDYAASILVSRGELRSAIVIPEGFRQNLRNGKGSELTLYVDNSKSTTALVATNAVKAYVSDLNEKIGTEFILEAWTQLRELNDNLRFLVGVLEQIKPVVVEIKSQLDMISQQFNEQDVEGYQTTLSNVRAYLNLLQIELDYVKTSMTTTETNSSAKEAAAERLVEIPQLNYSTNISSGVGDYRLELKKYIFNYCYALNSSEEIDDQCKELLQIYAGLDLVAEESEKLDVRLNEKIEEMNSIISQINEDYKNIAETMSRLLRLTDSNAEKTKELVDQLDSLDLGLSVLDETTKNITQTIFELQQTTDEYLETLITLTEELNHTIAVLDQYTQKDPSAILKPARVELKHAFENKLEIFYMLPALMSIVLLFIVLFVSSSLIVNERKGGTMARIFLSPVSMFFYVFEKVIFLLLLAIIAGGSMIISAVIFAVPITVNFPYIIVFLVAAIVYVCMGVFIGAISKSENTSLLTCLVVGFPLMFMSGAFSPPELMDKFVRIIAAYLPLTLNITLVERITIYGTSIDFTNLLVLGCIALVFYLLSVVMIWKKPTLK